MGWTGAGDTLNQVRIWFDTLDEATAFAKKEGFDYAVVEPQAETAYSKKATPTISATTLHPRWREPDAKSRSIISQQSQRLPRSSFRYVFRTQSPGAPDHAAT